MRNILCFFLLLFPLHAALAQTTEVDLPGSVTAQATRKYKNLSPDEKCTKIDFRVLHGCLEARFFDPSARVYFDTGTDGANEIDIFNNGGLNATIDFVSIYIPWRLGRGRYYDVWSWGPLFGAGISAAPQDSEDGTQKASDSPVVLFSTGLMLEYKFEDGPSFGFEVGYALGFSSDESLSNNNDNAAYVGLKINIPTSQRE
ncbi:MAG: hypothetical protein ACE5GK_00260 [Nitrospiria bacterium]